MSSDAMTFTVDYVGYDGRDYSNDFEDLATAQREAVSYSEHGCHCITITDSNGDEHSW